MNRSSEKLAPLQCFLVPGDGWYAHEADRIRGPFPIRPDRLPEKQTVTRARFTSSRYFHVNSEGWYVHTREGDKGPFATREVAEAFVANLVRAGRTRRREIW